MSSIIEDSPEADALRRLLDFPPVDHSSWKRRVEEELGDAAFAEALVARLPEGIDVEPLYAAGSAPAGAGGTYLGRRSALAPLVAEEYPIPDPEEAAAAIDLGLRHRVGVPWLPVRYVGDSPPRDAAPGAIRIAAVDELQDLLWGIPSSFEPVVEVVGGLKPLEPAVDDFGGFFVCDPAGEAFRSGEVGETLERAIADQLDYVEREGDRYNWMRTMLVSTSAHHEAGASAVDELAVALATGVDYLRRLSAIGLAAGKAATFFMFAFSVTDDLFLEIAKLRAARLLWSKVLGAAGLTEDWTYLHARGSNRTLSGSDPRTNLLRNTAQYFAAAVGGADSIALTPHDFAAETPSARGRRLAIMAQHILEKEAHLGRIADAAGGSWYLETLTDRLARMAWKLFQELEGAGGLVRCLRDGRVHDVVRRSAARRRELAEGER